MRPSDWIIAPGPPVNATEATIHLGIGVSINGYMLPDGRVRYSLEYLSVLIGHAENYLSRLTKKSVKKWKALLDKGFTAYLIPAKASRPVGGATIANTLSFDDFCLLIELEAELRNPKVIALLTASFRELLRSRTQQAFGLPEDSLEHKQADFQAAYESYLQREEALADARSEAEDLWLPGDERIGYDMLDEVLYYPDYSLLDY